MPALDYLSMVNTPIPAWVLLLAIVVIVFGFALLAWMILSEVWRWWKGLWGRR